MEFRIADTFTDSLARLAADEQKAAKTTAFDLQVNPAHPSLQFHKLEKAKDPRFWSVRVNLNVRMIVHRTDESLLLCYVDHHDKAYQWAERRKLETHPKTGAAQFVEIRETVQEIVVPQYVHTAVEAPPKPKLFATIPDEQLLAYGIPVEWLSEVRQTDEDTLLTLADHLPAEAAEALLEIATGEPRRRRSRFRLAPIRSSIPMRSAASASSRTLRNWNGRSNIRGKNGPFFCIPPSAISSNATIAVRHVFPARRGPGKRLSRCIALFFSLASIPTREYYSRHSRTHLPTHCKRSCAD